jgi:tetratricopeptide (TPR) repeat protein
LSLRCTLRTRNDQWAAAVDDATQAIEIRPAEGLYRAQRGIAQFLLARYDEATVDLKQAIDLGYAKDSIQKAMDFKLDPASPVFPILALIRIRADGDLETGTDGCLRAADWMKEHADWLDKKPEPAAVIRRMQAETSQKLVERWRQLAIQDAYARDKWWKGVSDCTSALRLAPKNVDILSLRCRFRTVDAQWAAAVDDATQAIAIRPKEGQYRSERGIAEFLLARYDEATVDLKQSIDLGFLNSAQLLRYAECLLQKALTDRPERASVALAEYRRICALGLDRFKGTKHIWEAHAISRMCLLVPDAVTDDRPVLQLAELGIKAIPKHRKFVDNMALLHLRSGQYDKAIERARQSLTLKPKVARGLTWLELSIAENHLGHAESAREWFQKADAWVNEQSKRLAKYPNARPDEFWFEVRLLQHEAKALLAGKKSAWD